MAGLGCGQWRAVLQCRGGGVLTELPFASLRASRRLDDMSDANVVVTGEAVNALTTSERDRCCGWLAVVNPWEHELALWRDDEEAWVGPILEPNWGVDDVVIPARDLFQWFERRLLRRDRTFVATDLATIFERYVVDALTRDPTPGIELNASATGILGDRNIQAAAYKRASDELRELSRSGLDFTAIGREILVGGTEIPTPALGTVAVEHFQEPGPRFSLKGLQATTETFEVGSRTAAGTIVGHAGGLHAQLGLLQDVASESSIADQESADAAAASRIALLGDVPQYVTGTLAASAPFAFDRLIPGAHARLALGLFCREVVGDYRLQGLGVSVDAAGDERIDVTFTNLGTEAA